MITYHSARSRRAGSLTSRPQPDRRRFRSQQRAHSQPTAASDAQRCRSTPFQKRIWVLRMRARARPLQLVMRAWHRRANPASPVLSMPARRIAEPASTSRLADAGSAMRSSSMPARRCQPATQPATQPPNQWQPPSHPSTQPPSHPATQPSQPAPARPPTRKPAYKRASPPARQPASQPASEQANG